MDDNGLESKLTTEAELQHHTMVKIPEKFVGYYSGRPRQLHTPFDYCISIEGRAGFFDAKACGKTSFDLDTYVFHEKKVHQYKSLIKAYSRGDIAGFVIWFYKLHRIGFICVADVRRMKEAGIKSINIKDVPGFRFQSDSVPFNFRNLLTRS